MTTLIINIILIVLEAFVINTISSLSSEKKRALFLKIVFCQLFIIHAFLDPDVMQDLPGYLETYKSFGENSLRESVIVGYVGVKMEPGWILLCKILYHISSNPRTLLIVTSLLMVGSYCKTISRYSFIPWLSVVIYLCTTFDQSLFVLRQHSAMAITLLSIPYIIRRDFLKYTLMMVIAVLIHSSSVIFIPMYFIYGINLKHFWTYFFIIAIVGVIAASTVFPWLFSHSWYDGYEEREGSNYTLFFISFCSFLLYLVSINFKVSHLRDADKYFFLLISMAVLLCFCGVGFSPTNRMAKYFSIASIIVIPRAISHFKGGVTKAILVIAVVLFHILLFLAPSNTEFVSEYRLIFF